jgi:hypothetical protein
MLHNVEELRNLQILPNYWGGSELREEAKGGEVFTTKNRRIRRD